jgi:hypothetical protein
MPPLEPVHRLASFLYELSTSPSVHFITDLDRRELRPFDGSSPYSPVEVSWTLSPMSFPVQSGRLWHPQLSVETPTPAMRNR